jgi:hypothetical protein
VKARVVLAGMVLAVHGVWSWGQEQVTAPPPAAAPATADFIVGDIRIEGLQRV